MRSAAVAIAQADAKERIRTARNVRRTGAALFGMAIVILVQPRRSLLYELGVDVNLHGGRSFMPFLVVLGAVVGVASPFVVAIGHLMLRRATSAARNNPVTAPILDQGEL